MKNDKKFGKIKKISTNLSSKTLKTKLFEK